MATIVTREDMIRDEGDLTFRGSRYGAEATSFIWVEMQPGEGVRLHRHTYEEVFIVLDGTATYRLGDEVIEVKTGDVIVGPANVPHAFTNTGDGILRQIDIHAAADIVTDWLEDA